MIRDMFYMLLAEGESLPLGGFDTGTMVISGTWMNIGLGEFDFVPTGAILIPQNLPTGSYGLSSMAPYTQGIYIDGLSGLVYSGTSIVAANVSINSIGGKASMMISWSMAAGAMIPGNTVWRWIVW